jgi:L-seryl-tRNA(Ser) seleniumtransferase
MEKNDKAKLAGIPKMDGILACLLDGGVLDRYPRPLVKAKCRQVLDNWRQKLLNAPETEVTGPAGARQAAAEVAALLAEIDLPSLRRVINATGIVLHTNLGRAPLAPAALARIVETGSAYANLEYDLQRGLRGERYEHVLPLLTTLTGAEEALVVNNNAAALLLALNSLAENREVIVSRGELIEIGGSFRLPEVMAKSGACLVEVGTTNRTRVSDYERAINPETAALLKVHTSNYRIVGFTEETNWQDLVHLGQKRGIPVLGDLGSGLLFDLAPYGITGEPLVGQIIAQGVDLVTFSGDKLLGGPQGGIIVGKKNLLTRIRANPLTRALRIDKLTLAALEATLQHYLHPQQVREAIPVLQALTEPLPSLRRRAGKLLRLLRGALSANWEIARHDDETFAGGGALPQIRLATAVVTIRPADMSISALDRLLRQLGVVARIRNDWVLLDCRTLADRDLPLIRDALALIAARNEHGQDQ